LCRGAIAAIWSGLSGKGRSFFLIQLKEAACSERIRCKSVVVWAYFVYRNEIRRKGRSWGNAFLFDCKYEMRYIYYTSVSKLLGLGQPAVSRAAVRREKLTQDMKLSLRK
jgi:hypothetical protein